MQSSAGEEFNQPSATSCLCEVEDLWFGECVTGMSEAYVCNFRYGICLRDYGEFAGLAFCG